MKTAGILGGMGPGTTADFYKEINELSERRRELFRPEMLIWNVPLNYEVETEMLLHQTGLEKYTPYLAAGARLLERAGADFGVVPCNTVHELYDEFTADVDIPFLHIVEETSSFLQERNISQVALLATGQTVNSQLYQGFLTEAGIESVVPSDEDQERLNTIVANLVTAEGATAGREGGEDRHWINERVDEYIREVGTVVLGCTDFHILLDERNPEIVVDSMQILAEATVAKIYE